MAEGGASGRGESCKQRYTWLCKGPVVTRQHRALKGKRGGHGKKVVENGVGDVKLSSWLRQWPSSPQPLPSGPLLTFLGVGSPQLHHGQVAGGGGAEGEVRGQGYRASLRRGRRPHPAGHKAAQEGLACREKGGEVPVRQPEKQVVTPGPPSQGPLLHESFTARNQRALHPLVSLDHNLWAQSL